QGAREGLGRLLQAHAVAPDPPGDPGRVRSNGPAAVSRPQGRALPRLQAVQEPHGEALIYAPGARYWICSALRSASIVSSTVRRTVVSSPATAPPPPMATA